MASAAPKMFECSVSGHRHELECDTLPTDAETRRNIVFMTVRGNPDPETEISLDGFTSLRTLWVLFAGKIKFKAKKLPSLRTLKLMHQEPETLRFFMQNTTTRKLTKVSVTGGVVDLNLIFEKLRLVEDLSFQTCAFTRMATPNSFPNVRFGDQTAFESFLANVEVGWVRALTLCAPGCKLPCGALLEKWTNLKIHELCFSYHTVGQIEPDYSKPFTPHLPLAETSTAKILRLDGYKIFMTLDDVAALLRVPTLLKLDFNFNYRGTDVQTMTRVVEAARTSNVRVVSFSHTYWPHERGINADHANRFIRALLGAPHLMALTVLDQRVLIDEVFFRALVDCRQLRFVDMQITPMVDFEQTFPQFIPTLVRNQTVVWFNNGLREEFEGLMARYATLSTHFSSLASMHGLSVPRFPIEGMFARDGDHHIATRIMGFLWQSDTINDEIFMYWPL